MYTYNMKMYKNMCVFNSTTCVVRVHPGRVYIKYKIVHFIKSTITIAPLYYFYYYLYPVTRFKYSCYQGLVASSKLPRTTFDDSYKFHRQQISTITAALHI